mgnify:FL=1
MRNLWLLPDFEQSGVVKALEGKQTNPIHEVIDLGTLPNSFVLGIPESVLRENQDENFVYAQYSKLNNGTALFSCSKRAGNDKTGRTVVITNLQILTRNETPIFPPEANPYAPPADASSMASFYHADDFHSANVKLMLEAVKARRFINSFASEQMPNSVNKPQWVPSTKKPLAGPWD